MHISLDEEQLANLETIFNKITQSFEKFSESINELTTSVEKLTEEIKNIKPSNS